MSNQVVTLTVTLEEAQVLVDALGTRPYNEVAPLQVKLRTQAQQQLNTSEPSPDQSVEKPRRPRGRPVKKVSEEK